MTVLNDDTRCWLDTTWAYGLKPIWGGTKFLPEKFVTAMTSPKKKVIACFAAPFSLLSAKICPTYVQTNVDLFFFFFGKNVRTLTQIARKIKSCPKFLQPGGASAPPGPPTSYAYVIPSQCTDLVTMEGRVEPRERTDEED